MSTSTAPPSTRTTKARHRRRRATSGEVAAVVTICVAAGTTAALTATATPTNWVVADLSFRAGMVVSTTLAGARARRWTLVLGSGLVTLCAGGWWGVAGLGALGVTFGLAWSDRRDRTGGAAVGALIGLTALHLAWPRTTLMTAVVATIAVVPIWVSAYRTSGRTVRRRVRASVGVAFVVVAVGLVAVVAFGLTQRSNVQAAIDDALGAADRIGSSSTADSTAGFTAARKRLQKVVAAANAPWMLPARVLPVVGVNLSSIRESAAAGADLADAAARLSGHVDYDRMHLPDGGIDTAVVSSFTAPLAKAEHALARSQAALADADSPLVVAPIAGRMAALERRVSRAHHDVVTARMGAEAAPAMLGADGVRRYLVLLGNPAEARDLGGHLGNWAEVTADHGHIEVVRVGEPYDMFSPGSSDRPFLPDAASFPRSLTEMNPTQFPQNWGASPDFPTVARLAAELFPQVPGGGSLDGVVYADTKAFAAALAITGPVPIPGTTRTLDSANAAAFLERGQYSEFEGESTGDRAVTDMVRDALHRLLDGRIPSPQQVATHFGPVADDGHLRFVPLHEDEMAFARRLGLVGAVEPLQGGDLLAVLNRNANPSKIDSYLRRTIVDRVTFDPSSGAVRSDVEVTLTNTAPASGLPRDVGNPPPGSAPGTNRTELAVITPLAATGATVDGQDTALGTRSDVHGLRRHSVLVDLAPGQERTVVIGLKGSVRGPDYRFRWIAQPLANPDRAQLVIRSTGQPFRGGAVAGSLDLPQSDRDLTVRTEP